MPRPITELCKSAPVQPQAILRDPTTAILLLFTIRLSALVEQTDTSQYCEEWKASDIKDIEEFSVLAKVLALWF